MLLAALAMCASSLRSARLAADEPRFDVASVKPNASGPVGNRTLSLVPGGIRVVNLPLSTILWMAHGVQQDQIVNVPSWATSEAFDIVAKAPEGTRPSMDVYRPMLRELLADRFHLQTHHETRELPVYRLLRLRDASLGPKLSPAAIDCTGRPPETAEGRIAMRSCGAGPVPGGLRVHGMPLLVLGRFLGPVLGRVVVDETGLKGNWDLDLEYTTEQIQGGDGVSPFTAVQEQLGLKLEAGRAPVEVIVLDHLDRPMPD